MQQHFKWQTLRCTILPPVFAKHIAIKNSRVNYFPPFGEAGNKNGKVFASNSSYVNKYSLSGAISFFLGGGVVGWGGVGGSVCLHYNDEF